MPQEEILNQSIELTREISFPGDVRFDPDAMIINGSYCDQLSAYRARRIWSDTLESCFLLDPGGDFVIRVRSSLEQSEFAIECEFISACGRYAFWRLTNHQAPEAEYMLETAHIPSAESRHDDLLTAPDLRSVLDQQIGEIRRKQLKVRKTVIGEISRLIKRWMR